MEEFAIKTLTPKEIVDKSLNALKERGYAFESMYKTMNEIFSNEIFSERTEKGNIERVTFNEFFAKTEEFSKKIVTHFANNSNDIIGIYMENSAEWVELFWATLMAGFKPLLLNTRQGIEITQHVIDEVKPVAVFCDKDEPFSNSLTVSEFVTFELDSNIESKWSDTVIFLTSGSTDFPKIICHNGKSIGSQVKLTADLIKMNPAVMHNRKAEMKLLAFLPFYHIFGLVSMLMWFSFFGRTMVFLPDYSQQKIQNTCQRHGVTHFFAIPMVWNTAVESLLAEVEKQGKTEQFMKLIKFSNSLQNAFPVFGAKIIRKLFKSIRQKIFGTELNFCISGGGFVQEKTAEILNGIGYSLHIGYGLTECGILSVNLAKKPSERNASNNGRIFSTIKYRTTSDDELEIYKDSACTEIFKDGHFVKNELEYYPTNDKVKFTKDNELIVVGRVDDIIVTEGGENISPQAAEQSIDFGTFENMGIFKVNVQNKEQLVLCVSCSEKDTQYSMAISVKKIYDSISKLAVYERPSKVLLVSGDIQHNFKGVDRKSIASGIESGKLTYSELSRPSNNDIERYKDTEYKTTLSEIKKIFADVSCDDIQKVNDNTDFIADLSGDSLKYLDLVSSVSDRFSVDISLDDKALLTPVEFTDYVVEARKQGAK